ncbi:MAG: hypothetical protein HC894_28800 [Microcoleus sp. SM1_3_4]|nr:hypothetical protein [Microcoleus sp. SM1_3_4]
MVDRDLDTTSDILKFAPAMNVFLAISENLPAYIEVEIQAGDCTSAVEYLLDLCSAIDYNQEKPGESIYYNLPI